MIDKICPIMKDSTTFEVSDIDFKTIGKEIEAILIRSGKNYRCDKCGSPLGIWKETFESWECETCGHSRKVIEWVNDNEFEGYQIIEYDVGGYPKVHFLGIFK